MPDSTPDPSPVDPSPVDPSPVDTALLDRLQALWAERDPVPADLVDDLVAAVAVADLESEWLLLEPSSAALVGVRSRGDVDTVQFQLGDVRLTLRISAQAHGRRRFDGWLTGVDAGAGATVFLTVPTPLGPPRQDEPDDDGDAVVASSPLDRHGRFAFPDVARGRSWQLRLDLGGHGLRYETPAIDC